MKYIEKQLKIYHITLLVSLVFLLSLMLLLKTFLIGGKHLFPYFGFLILLLIGLFFYISLKKYRKRLLLFSFIYLVGYILFTYSFFSYFNWPNHDKELIFLPSEYNPNEWITEKPNFVDFDTIELSKIFYDAEKIKHLCSILIVKDEKLVVEKYFHGGSKNVSFNIGLISQTFIASLIGIAINEKIINNVNQNVLYFFPEYKNKEYVSDKKDLTVENLLLNTANFYGDKYERSFKSLNWTKSILIRPKIKRTNFSYLQQQTAHLLSAIITKASCITTRDFADSFLCKPLNINIIEWFKSPEGIYRGSNAIYFCPRDIARYGNLYINGGKYNNKQIIPEKWVEQSTSKHIKSDLKINDNFRISNLGYSWLLGKMVNYNVFLATDFGGQFIINIPNKKITIVTTTNKPFDYILIENLVCKIVSTIK